MLQKALPHPIKIAEPVDSILFRAEAPSSAEARGENREEADMNPKDINMKREDDMEIIFKGQTSTGQPVWEIREDPADETKGYIVLRDGKTYHIGRYDMCSDTEWQKPNVEEVQIIMSTVIGAGKDISIEPLSEDDARNIRAKGEGEGFFLKNDSSLTIVKAKGQLADRWALDETRILTDEESELVPVMSSRHKEAEWADRVAGLIKSSNRFAETMRVVTLAGESGSGKSEGARQIASELGLPYVSVVGFPTMKTGDLLLKYVPNPDKKTKDDPDYIAVESEFVKAFRYGWLCEMQEMNIVKDEGVLTSLNGALEHDTSEAKLVLPTGEIVHRHPDFVCIYTMNLGYTACKKIQQSVSSRMTGIFKVDTPSDREVADRVEKQTMFPDRNVLNTMTKIIGEIGRFMKANDINDGVCGTREAISWAKTALMYADMYNEGKLTNALLVSAALPTVVEKVSQDTDEDYDTQVLTGIFQKYYDEKSVAQARNAYADGRVAV